MAGLRHILMSYNVELRISTSKIGIPLILSLHDCSVTIHVSMFVITVEWSKEALIEAWMADPVAACEKAGVTLPESEFILHQRKGAGKLCGIS